MCRAISIIMSETAVYEPAHDGWDHSHTSISRRHGLPDSLIGDKFARVEVTPPDDVWRDKDTNAVRTDIDSFTVRLDENREPGWWADDKPAQIDRARRAAQRWLASHPDNLVPGYRAIGGNFATLTGGNGATLTGGDYATLTGGNGATLTGGNGATLTGGDYATLTGGYRATLTGGYRATLCWRVWDGSRYRIHVWYVGEDGIEANTPYVFRDGNIQKGETDATEE